MDLRGTKLHESIRAALAPASPLHLPVAFPEVFIRTRPGFDVILGNPPWEKLRVEKHEFWARHFPGLRGIKSTAERDAQVARLARARSDLVRLEAAERAEGEVMRDAVRDLPGMNTGHPDLFRAFMARFAQLLAPEGGRYGVVLPGEAFKVKGNGPVRQDLDQRACKVDVQMLTNRAKWVFDVHAQKPIALVAVQLGAQDQAGCTYVIRPEFHRESPFRARDLGDNVERGGVWLRSYSPGLVLPTLPTAAAATSMGVIEQFMRAPRLAEHPRLRVRRVYADVETSRKYKDLYAARSNGNATWPVYGGESFDVWNPDTRQYYAFIDADVALNLVQKKRAESPRGAPYAELPAAWRSNVSTHPCLHPRLAYRDVTNRTNTRTLVGTLIPGGRVLTQSAPWVLWTDPSRSTTAEAYLLGVMSSIPADWWARRFVEGHVDEEAFDCLRVPNADPETGLGARAVALAGRLACPDDRFATWAASVGVAHGPLDAAEKQAMIEELDAVVARLYGLTPAHLTHVFDTFHDWPSEREWTDWNARRDRTVATLRGLA